MKLNYLKENIFVVRFTSLVGTNIYWHPEEVRKYERGIQTDCSLPPQLAHSFIVGVPMQWALANQCTVNCWSVTWKLCLCLSHNCHNRRVTAAGVYSPLWEYQKQLCIIQMDSIQLQSYLLTAPTNAACYFWVPLQCWFCLFFHGICGCKEDMD